MKKYLFKSEISGSQSFIFHVPIKGVPIELRKRLAYLQNITDKCLKKLKEFFNSQNVVEIFSDCRTFVFEVHTDKNENEIYDFIKTLENEYLKQEIFPHIAFVEKRDNFSKILDSLHTKLHKAKLQLPIYFESFESTPVLLPDVEEKIRQEYYNKDFDTIIQHPESDNKWAAIKIDVDSLTALFKGSTEEDYKKISKNLKEFFDDKLSQLIKESKMQQNIFCVYSWGDCCFLIGSWSVVFELSIILQQKFDELQRNLKTQIPSLFHSELSFSAGIVVVAAKFPMIQLMEEVEKALQASKASPGKNCVTVFGKTLLWHEFIQSQKIANQLVHLIQYNGETKNLINRIKSSDVGFDELQQNAHDGKINIPKVWRLKYYLRNVKKENEEAIKTLFEEYTKAILDTFMKRKTTNPNLYPVAARWAELLLK